MSWSAVGVAQATPDTAARLGNHFVVLIDDSGDMRQHRHGLERYLADFLYGGEERQTSGRPRFHPERDLLSVVFFAIHRDQAGDRCKGRRRYSALPDSIFQPIEAPAERVQTKQGFTALLSEQLRLSCRFQGNLSPISTALSLALPFLDDGLPGARQFSRTFVVTANNGAFNSQSSPVFELRNFLRFDADVAAGQVDDTEAAENELQEIAPLFRFHAPKGWSEEHGRRPNALYLSIFEVVPLAPAPVTQLSYRQTIQLRRVARSRDALSIEAQLPEQADLRIALPEKNEARDAGFLEPLRLFWRFEDESGAPFAIGGIRFPHEEQQLDLRSCARPCRREEGQLVIPLLELAGKLALSPDDAVPLSAGRIEFSVAFRFATGGKYDRAVLETPIREIRLLPAPLGAVASGVFFTELPLDNQILTELWRRGDARSPAGGLTQEVAKDRILAQRDLVQLFILIASIAGIALLVLALLYYFYCTAYHRPFCPRLIWQPVAEVEIDFSRPAAGRLLVGTLEVVNDAEVPWFGQRLGNDEQPARPVAVKLSDPAFEDLGLKIADGAGSPIGFLEPAFEPSPGDLPAEGAAPEPAPLTLQTAEVISHGKRIFLFLAGEMIRDLALPEVNGEFTSTIPIAVEMSWNVRTRRADGWRSVLKDIPFRLRVTPEAAREPLVEFQAAESKLFFRQGQAIGTGYFLFHSRAEHQFALPFTGDYLLRSSRDNVSLGGDPIRLATPRLTLPPRRTGKVPVAIHCDGEIVPNPHPAKQSYELSLVGSFHAASAPGPHRVLLHRDPTRAEIELDIRYQGTLHEIFWVPDGTIRKRLFNPDGESAGESDVIGERLSFATPFAVSFTQSMPALNVLSLRVGNSAISGRGSVQVQARHRLLCHESHRHCLHPRGAVEPEAVLEFYNHEEPCGKSFQLEVKEGEAAQRRDLRLDPARIDRIDGARIPADRCRVEVQLEILVRDDQGRESQRKLTLVVALGLEQLPGRNWLCIDFGTSAIAAAVGSDAYDNFKIIPLQSIRLLDGENRSYGSEDPGNAERNTPFLPSWVICDADQRTAGPGAGSPAWPAGFPKSRPASIRPGEATFLGLPALDHQLEEKAGRMIFSLKSWLGKSSRFIRLREKVRYLLNSTEVTDGLLPLDAVVESSFAALTEAYLLRVPYLQADQIALCHPNTFTARHKERLHAIASRALMRRLKIASPEHIRLISESDAVAYHYCTERLRDEPRGGEERILVYDFGAGTLDLSIIQVEWNREPCYPKNWTVEGRIGVPVAGNFIDEILARLVDRLLRDPKILNVESLEYTYPLVGDRLPDNPDAQRGHRGAVYRLWRWIKEAKHGWRDGKPFDLKIGDTHAKEGIVTYDPKKGGLPTTVADDQIPAIWLDSEDIRLSIPARDVHQDGRMATFLRFVTETVVDEALSAAGLRPEDVDTLIVSGRGALWPGLKDRLYCRFPADTHKPKDLLENGRNMKEAVVRGAIARQGLLRDFTENGADRAVTRLGVLIANDTQLIPEEQWGKDKAIDLTNSPTFRLVQVTLRRPDPRKDFRSLRRWFYIDLNDQPYLRDSLWGKDPRLYLEKSQDNGHLTVMLRNSLGQEMPAFSDTAAPSAVTNPPWPIGQVLLDPKE